jgi:ATP-dependent helicase/nuclease subunit B
VVGGADQWQERLEEYAGASDDRAAEYKGSGDGGEEWKAFAAERDATLARSLRDFVSELNERLTTQLPDGRSWREWSEWACGALERYLGNAFHHAAWPDEEQDSFIAVVESLSALAALDELGEPAEVSAFRSAASQALEAPAGRVGRFGDGVMVGPIRQGRNLLLDSVFVVGLTEGYLPSGSGRSGLLLDDDRQSALSGFGDLDHLRTLDTREIRQNRQASALEAALRSASGTATLTWSRSELRSARPHLPSRWLLAAAATLAGRYVGLEDLDDLSRGGDARFTEVVSFASGLSRVGEEEHPASLFDRDIAQLNDWVNGRNGRLEDHPVAREGPAAAYAATAAERRRGFNRFSGKIDPAKLRLTRRHSATKLETWAACPFRWFLGEALRLSHEEPPEDVIQIAPRERGTLVHLILERYTLAVMEGATPSAETIRPIAEEVFADFQRRGLTGKALLWDYQRQLILRELETFVDLDTLEPVAAELSFGRGPDDNPPVEIEVGGEVIPFSGSADRVDRQGNTLVVTDYKTGGAFKGLDADPVMAGTKLQLHIYARAARAIHGEPNTPVRARYWFVSEKGEFAEESVDLDRDSGRFEEVLEVITSGIKSGLFPARPGADSYFGFENCSFCDFSHVCPVDRDRHWETVRNDPELIDYRKLAEPDPEEDAS